MEAFEQLKINELRAECRRRGLRTSSYVNGTRYVVLRSELLALLAQDLGVPPTPGIVSTCKRRRVGPASVQAPVALPHKAAPAALPCQATAEALPRGVLPREPNQKALPHQLKEEVSPLQEALPHRAAEALPQQEALQDEVAHPAPEEASPRQKNQEALPHQPKQEALPRQPERTAFPGEPNEEAMPCHPEDCHGESWPSWMDSGRHRIFQACKLSPLRRSSTSWRR